MKTFFKFIATLGLICLASTLGHAQLTVTLDNPTQTAQPGAQIIFTGTVTNNGSSTVFLNGDTLAISTIKTDDSPFLAGAPISLAPGAAYSGQLFSATLSASVLPGDFPGGFSVLGGADANTYTSLSSAVVDISVAPPQATITLSNFYATYYGSLQLYVADNGSPQPVTATTTPPGLAVDITYNGSETPPTAPGSYTVVAAVADDSYQGVATGTLVITTSQTPFANYPDGNGGLIITGYTGFDYSISIPSTIDGLPVTGIANYAFAETELESVTIPNGVTSIGEDAFYFCITLTSVTIPNSVTTIGDGAFEGCESLTSVIIPNGVTSIGDALADTDGGPFQYCSSLTSVTIPNSVTSIGDSAFYQTGLTSVTIPNSVTSIGDYAFCYCGGLTSATIPNSVTRIGNYAFYGCGLTGVTIPANLTSMGDAALSDCSHLTAITVDSANPAYSSVNGVMFDKNQATLIQYPAGSPNSSYTIPNSVTSIADYVFASCTSLSSVAIPNSVTSIGANAFSGCYGLTSLTIPNSLTSIGDHAFAGSNLTSVTIPNSVTSIGDYAFNGCSSLTNVIIPNSVTSIGAYAFENCDSLTSVTIPAGVTSIGYLAFEFSSLTNAVFNGNAPTMGGYVFANTATGFTVYYYNGATGFTSPTWTPDSDDSYPAVNFATISSQFSTESDGNGGLIITGYSGLGGVVVIPGAINGLTVTGIGNAAFQNQAGLTSVTIPNSVTSIGNQAFEGCGGLPSMTIPNSVTSIGDDAFEDCSGLSSMTIPNSVTSIGGNTFSGCTILASVRIGNGVASIGAYAFSDCASLTSVVIPASVTSIGDDAFANSSLQSAVFLGNAPTMGAQVFIAYDWTGGELYGSGTVGTIVYYDGGTGFTTPFWTDNSGDLYESVDQGNPNDPFNGIAQGGGWNYSSWFGEYNNTYYPWIYRTDLGFIYVDTPDNANLYLYVVNGNAGSMGWFYTNWIEFPNVYDFSENSWLYFFSGGTSFYNYTTQAFEFY